LGLGRGVGSGILYFCVHTEFSVNLKEKKWEGEVVVRSFCVHTEIFCELSLLNPKPETKP